MLSSAPAAVRLAAEVAIRHRIGALPLDVGFAVTAPWTVLFGASGSGKSTILRAMAGLIRPDHGRIVLHGETVSDSSDRTWVPAHRRNLRWAGQRAALFPRMTVAENLAFGLRANPAPPRLDGAALDHAVEAFHLTQFARRRVNELSGGERQRVSVARAAVGAVGRLLLLDEPFSGLDATVRDRLIEDLRGWLGETPILSVTHDVGEAFLLDAEVVRLAEGKIVAQGPVGSVLDVERDRLLRVLG